MATMLSIPQAFLDDAGLPVQGGKVYTYDSGTTNPRSSYSDLAGTIPNANPLTLDAGGRANIFGTGFFTLKVYRADGITLVRTIDGVGVTVDASTSKLQREVQSASNGQTLVTFSTVTYTPGTNGLQVYLNGILQMPSDYTETSSSSITFTRALSVSDEVLVMAGALVTDSAINDSSQITYATIAFSRSVQAKLNLDAPMPEDFGAVGDGASHPLSNYYGTLAAAQAKFPNAVALSDEIDGTVIQYLCNLGIKWCARQSSSSIYLTTYGIDSKHGTRAYGSGQWTATATVSKNTCTSEIKYVGATGADTYVWKIADQAIGVDPTGSPSTRDMQNCALRDWTLNANGLAGFALVEVRAWAGNDLDNLTLTGAVRYGNWAAQCWDKGPQGRIAAFNRGAGFNWGGNPYSWSNATTVDQAAPKDCIAYYNGCDTAGVPLNQFNEGANAGVNYGFGIFGSRALTLVNCQSLNNDGVGIYLNTAFSPVTFLGGYVEGNSRSSQIVKVDNFTGNGATTAYTLSNAFGKANYVVTVGGVLKASPADYSVAWAAGVSTLTFTSAPANAAAIVVTYNRQWATWNASTINSWAIRIVGMDFGLSPAHRLTGTAPSRLGMGPTFESCPFIGEVVADWNAWNMVNCEQTAVITSTLPGTPVMSVGGLATDVGTSNAGYIIDRIRGVNNASFTLGGTTADGTGAVYSAANLFSWRRQGNVVEFNGTFALTTLPTGTTGGLLLRGLPYTCLSGFAFDAPVSIAQIGNLTTAVVSMSGVVRNNTQQIELYMKTAAATGDSAMALANVSNTTLFRISGRYFTNDA